MTDTNASEQPEDGTAITAATFRAALEELEEPVATASAVARVLDCSQTDASDALDRLAEAGKLDRQDVGDDPVVWYPREFADFVDPEHVVVFPERRELVVEQPEQFTRAQLTQFAHLVDSADEAYIYEIREEDVWWAPYDHIDGLVGTMRDVLGEPAPELEEWVERQWTRARKFALTTHQDGYTVLEAESPELMGNVARQKLDADQLHGPISDTESWVVEGKEGSIKRTLYDAGYPVQDQRELEGGAELDIDLGVDLREYQEDWLDRFLDTGAGVLVGPPGSGKTIAAIGAMAEIGGETLILAPGRELAGQWHEQLLTHTSLDPEQIGEYHGGEKEIRPVTIATYRTAGMDRHRKLFDERRWGLIVYDEVHHVPAAIYRRSADLQAKHRLGLSATPIREDDKEGEIFTLIGPPIGTDWAKLFEAGFVAEPEVELRYVPWRSEEDRTEYASVEGYERRQVAGTNPAKLDAIRSLLADHADAKTLIFVEWLDQGREYSDALDIPFISGETRYAERERLFDEFRRGERSRLLVSRVGDEGIDLPNAEVAIVASGLGGSRRQGSQRAGRTMRPSGNSQMYVLATRGTREEEFARNQLRHLAGKGVRLHETDAD
ncbi:DEAD/DEAH box helicase [Halococcus thailandensis]|uniref:Putative DNA 3'-5' helicase Rad25 n=1 Tax=Halococcus thailandensis JCM 13552 TaxID=1227457 RepID=M0N2Y4_9EURY|nr:DEAD/DEAH box helicase [Halococcus thailandensis]EMA51474.1 DNA/RNA helicase, superfamily ii [Halococcus thailandensis JCM 13552]